MIRVLFANAIILFSSPQDTEAADLLKCFRSGTHFPFILCLTCSFVTAGQLHFRDASTTAVLQVLSVFPSGVSAPEFSIISALSLEVPFFISLLLLEGNRRIAVIVSADRGLP